MMTKDQYAKSIVKEFCKKELDGRDPNEIRDWGDYIHMSSSLAVALEHLGLLTEEQKEYSSSRGGVHRAYIKGSKENDDYEFATLSTREIISLLPTF